MTSPPAGPPPVPPAGTVTLLFTDIEGSTSLWETHPQEMRAALSLHDTLLRRVIESQGGHVFKTVGDAFCAAFVQAPDAVAAALAAQQALLAQLWPAPVTLRVRMALHTGAVESRDGDYFGPPLNRVARLLAAGHGGQVLLTDAAQALTRDLLPAGASLLNRGEHRLKDLTRPEPIFQLCHPALAAPSDFPPLKSLDNPGLPHNLPQVVTRFIGREKETASIEQLLSASRLLTLTGAGGAGKTRLALHVATEALTADTDRYRDGVWLVELAPVADPALVADAALSALQVTRNPNDIRPALTALTEYLRTRRLLLVLDNGEHVLTGAASVADALLRICPSVTLLVTSREALNVTGETTYRVPSLTLPAPGEAIQAASPHSLRQYEAVQLFVDRATAVLPAFTLTDANAPAVASVCWRLDGIPLALELAAARVRALSVEEINRRLDDRFRLLTGGSRSSLPRQQTLRAAVDWSYNLLREPERHALCRLSVFAGGWTLPAAETVLVGEPIDEWDVLDLLTSLVDKSLVVYDQMGETPRYRLLETVRQYARERLADSPDEATAARNRHLAWCVSFAQSVFQEDRMHGGALETETDNLRTAMEWGTTSEAGDPLVPFRLLRLIWSTEWSMRGRLGECREWARRLVGRLGATDQRGEYVRALGIEALIVWYQGDAEGALPLAEETLRCVEAAGDPDGARDSRHLLGVIYQSAARYEDARAIHAQDLAWLAEHDQGADHRFEVATSLYRLGRALSGLGEIREAEYRLTESLTLFLAEEDAEAKQGNARWGISRSLFLNRLALASAARHQGRWSEAGKHGIVGLPFLDDCPEPRLVAMGIEGIALLSAAFGETDTAARLWGAADQLREQCGSKRSADEAREYAPAYQAAQASGREAFALARAEGAALGRNGALHFARAFLERLTATDSANA